MAVAQRMSEHEYEQFVMSGVEGAWELHDGVLIEKPRMSREHGTIVSRLAYQLLTQLDEAEYAVRMSDGRLRKLVDTVVIPDLAIVPSVPSEPEIPRHGLLMIDQALPLVVEVWSSPADGYDVDAKIPIYKLRGDLEIWRIHPGERTLTSWARQPDGTYAETIYLGGLALPAMLRTGKSGRGTRFDA